MAYGALGTLWVFHGISEEGHEGKRMADDDCKIVVFVVANI